MSDAPDDLSYVSSTNGGVIARVSRPKSSSPEYETPSAEGKRPGCQKSVKLHLEHPKTALAEAEGSLKLG